MHKKVSKRFHFSLDMNILIQWVDWQASGEIIGIFTFQNHFGTGNHKQHVFSKNSKKVLNQPTLLYSEHPGEVELLYQPGSSPGVADRHSEETAGRVHLSRMLLSLGIWHHPTADGTLAGTEASPLTCAPAHAPATTCTMTISQSPTSSLLSSSAITTSTFTTIMVQSRIYSTPSFSTSTKINLTSVATECKPRSSSTQQKRLSLSYSPIKLRDTTQSQPSG